MGKLNMTSEELKALHERQSQSDDEKLARDDVSELKEKVLDLMDEINPHPVVMVKALNLIIYETLDSMKLFDRKDMQ